MQLQEVLDRYADDLRIIEEYLEAQQQSYVHLIPEIARHIIQSGGKRLRPLLLIICSDLCGYRGDRRYTLAAVMEFIHTASLLHDDVIDHADLRRGKVSANRVWGNSASVLVGDYLYSKSFKILAEDEDTAVQKLLSMTTTTMVEGEIVQLVRVGNADITEKEYLSVIEKKTAVLISASCAVGAILARSPQSHIEALARFGMRLGMAFQLTDDTLDYMAAEEEFGKAVGKDLMEGKVTLPVIEAFRKGAPEERTAMKEIIERKAAGDGDVERIMSLIGAHGGIQYALSKAGHYIKEAKSFLKPFADSAPKQSLVAISDYVIARRL
ncbi:MAG: polyprenyl synthetase family protein [Deltaproteobacteria bacterium]|nr:polyprenyl synthetase family protein [Deltaproteobacteria bacterium]